jgi:SAM-dependent methyltransferase
MTDAAGGPSGHTYLDFNAPLCDDRAARLLAGLGPLDGARVLDLGCGWAELLLRLAAAAPAATGLGVDTDVDAVERGRAAARDRGLDGRVRLEVGDVTAVTEVADVVVSVGASHAWGDSAAALAALRERLEPGGRVLLGDAVWRTTPRADLVEQFGDLQDVPGLVDLAQGAGFRVLSLGEASQDEWDDFESRYCAGRERWLLEHPGDDAADRVRTEADEHRRFWLRGYRGVLGFAYLTLALPR